MKKLSLQYPLILAGLLLCNITVLAAPVFPKLTGRVVDNAGLLDVQVEKELTNILAQHETETTNEIVVVTLTGLQGYPIEDFGYQLGRHWGIGKKGVDNGVLLIIAPRERKVRIEVGYGLEGRITDALANHIIQTRILPSFKKNAYQVGIVNGTQAIIDAVKGAYKPPRKENWKYSIILIVFIGVMILFIWSSGNGGNGYRRRSGGYYSGGYSGSSHGSGYSGGFSGGGGSFGGGGASGGW